VSDTPAPVVARLPRTALDRFPAVEYHSETTRAFQRRTAEFHGRPLAAGLAPAARHSA